MKAFLILAAAAFGAVAHGQDADPDPRRMQAAVESRAIAARVQERQQRADARDAARHEENRQRCETALRVAKLCGQHGGTFYCDAKGFRAIPEAQRARAAPLDNQRKFEMHQCARRAAQGGP